MLTIKRKHESPPGGYWYHDDALAMDLMANTLNQLIEKATGLRKLNDLEVPEGFGAIIEDAICQHLPNSFVVGRDETAQHQWAKAYMPLSVVKVATEIFLTGWRNSGRHVVSVEEADRRADVCIACDGNRVNKACLGCRGLISWVRQWTQRKSTRDDALLVCNACAIMNAAHIHADEKWTRRSTNAESLAAMPETCWKKQICKGVQ